MLNWIGIFFWNDVEVFFVKLDELSVVFECVVRI